MSLSQKKVPLGLYVSFKRFFDEKHKSGEILIYEGGAVNINELPFPSTKIEEKTK